MICEQLHCIISSFLLVYRKPSIFTAVKGGLWKEEYVRWEWTDTVHSSSLTPRTPSWCARPPAVVSINARGEDRRFRKNFENSKLIDWDSTDDKVLWRDVIMRDMWACMTWCEGERWGGGRSCTPCSEWPGSRLMRSAADNALAIIIARKHGRCCVDIKWQLLLVVHLSTIKKQYSCNKNDHTKRGARGNSGRCARTGSEGVWVEIEDNDMEALEWGKVHLGEGVLRRKWEGANEMTDSSGTGIRGRSE